MPRTGTENERKLVKIDEVVFHGDVDSSDEADGSGEVSKRELKRVMEVDGG